MQKTANRPSGLPLYLEIATDIRRAIAEGRWRLGDKLPPISELARQYEVAPLTARQAVKHLEGRGLVKCKRGAGTFVSGLLLELQSLPLRSDLRDVVDKIELGQLVNLPLPRRRQQPELPSGVKAAAAYKQLYRLFKIEDQPALVSQTFLDRSLFDEAPVEFAGSPALPLAMKLRGNKLRRVLNVMTIDSASEEIADALNLASYAPVAKLRLVLKDEDDVGTYIGTLIFPAELVRVEFDVE
ncbi:MAG: GntR family transcriptional regulator [Gammaproteobacteria bacterium]